MNHSNQPSLTPAPGPIWASFTVLLFGLSLLLLPGCASTDGGGITEESLMQKMQSSNADIATEAMLTWERTYPTSTNAFGIMRSLLTDSRPQVRRKAARVLGVLHAEVSEQDIQNICAMLTSADNAEATDALKSLRGLKAPGAVDKIVPLLNHSNANIVRDACRTLAVLGTKDVIPKIEPLLTRPEPAVQKDAQDAIFILRGKSS